ncbi:type II toxin-antitoxin system VapC family toxin [Sphingomonas sp. CLY1604]|uniref:type II toxin-antitoxin system VapC family toxin n=1 Tax=Sphingomonas sp. CLY1604 TaxID=3457786 RepID=UPI003FD85E10
MILVDTSVWLDFFVDAPTRQVAVLAEKIDLGEVIVGDLVLMEMLQGCRSDTQAHEIQRITTAFDHIEISDRYMAVEAARNYRHLRGLGITIRKTIDTLIATRCILDRLPLLYSDRDFDPFVQHLGLRSAMAETTGVN